MKKRLLCLGLLAAVSQLFATGCFFHPVARWRANHPCGACVAARPLLHPIQTRRAILGAHVGTPVGDPIGAPVPGVPVCHGCNGAPGATIGFAPGAGDLVPVTHPPTIGHPYPITPGPTVIPSYELPAPMPVKPGQ